jgi:hypothetical protein
LHRVTGTLSLAIWLFMAVADIHPPLHAWLHGGTIPKDDDDCAIMMIHHGKVDTSVVVVEVSVAPALVVADVLTPAPIFAPVDYSLFPSRGPPAPARLS